ncbi:hypothetical protein BT96DRAFT_945894 [Gymnopus androsaceus JB14]|uniref:Uncharacterized protein n=1 Tax=Gymnopus androsaceus JB14 TaxID=1447944 RepID=A0A6A4GZ18_9AGAR|nr:hypothetical protein BT96DRAFT_945894 [Gymnopus androsaceus JB14]
MAATSFNAPGLINPDFLPIRSSESWTSLLKSYQGLIWSSPISAEKDDSLYDPSTNLWALYQPIRPGGLGCAAFTILLPTSGPVPTHTARVASVVQVIGPTMRNSVELSLMRGHIVASGTLSDQRNSTHLDGLSSYGAYSALDKTSFATPFFTMALVLLRLLESLATLPPTTAQALDQDAALCCEILWLCYRCGVSQG